MNDSGPVDSPMAFDAGNGRGVRNRQPPVVRSAGAPARRVVAPGLRARAGLIGNPFTVAKPIAGGPKEVEKLQTLLRSIGENLKNETVLNLRDLRLVHYLRWVIVPQPDSAPHLLVFGSDYDGTLEEHLTELWELAGHGEGLNEIYAYCEGSPRFSSAADFIGYFGGGRIRTEATYSGSRDRSVQQVLQEDELQRAVADYVDSPAGRKACKSDPQRAIAAFVRGQANPPVDLDEDLPDTTTLLSKIAHGPGVILLGLAALGIVLVPGLIFFGLVWIRERTETLDVKDQGEQDAKKLDQLKEREDHKVQNQLTHLVPIKPGRFRMFSLKLVLWAINLLARNYFDRGNLGGIPSIHYARWMILEEKRLLLFFSNFDGSWESYLGDFVDQAATGLTGIWSNTVGFPKALLLVLQGARDEERFKNWTRAHQLETQIWYSAYPDLSVQNVNDNTTLRKGLAHRPALGAAYEAWLRTL